MLSGEAENTNCIDFNLTHLDIDPMINVEGVNRLTSVVLSREHN